MGRTRLGWNEKRMESITLKLTPEEVKLLASLASDQLFRKEFIDPKMPGHKAAPGEITMGKSLVGRLRLTLEQTSPKKIVARKSS